MSDDSLRSAEREARDHPGGETLSRLAFELARASRHDDAFSAAVRAVAHDPAAPARALLRASWTEERGGHLDRAVAWPGLRRLGRVRTLEGVPGGSLSSRAPIVDLGRGLIAYMSAEVTLVVDVLAGRVLRRLPRHRPLGALDGDLVAMTSDRDGNLVVETVEPASGVVRAAIELGFRVARHSYFFEDHRFTIQQLDREGFIRDRADPERGILHTFDLRSGELLARFELPPLRHSDLDRAGDTILVMDAGTARGETVVCRAFDLRGRELWSMQDAVPEGFVDGRILYSSLADDETAVPTVIGSPTPLVPFSGGVSCVAEDVVVATGDDGYEILERRTLDVVWAAPDMRRGRFYVGRVAATRNALLFVEAGRVGYREDELVSRSPLSGAELSRVPLGALPGDAPEERPRDRRHCALAAGHAIVGSTREVDVPLLVVEDADVM